MKKIWVLVVGVVLVFSVVILSSCSPGGTTFSGVPSNLRVNLSNQQEGIWVNGTGEVSVVPDIATLR